MQGPIQIGARLLRQYPEALRPADQLELREAVGDQEQALAGGLPLLLGDGSLPLDEFERRRAPLLARTRTNVQRVGAVLRNSPQVLALAEPGPVHLQTRLVQPYGSAVLLLRRTAPEQVRGYRWTQLTLGLDRKPRVELPDALSLCVLEILNPDRQSGTYTLELASAGEPLGFIDVDVAIPPAHKMRIDLREDGKPVAAAVQLVTAQGKPLTPTNALDFSEAGFSYSASRLRRRANSDVFFVEGSFELAVPAGSYSLQVSRGPEYLPVSRTIEVGKRDLHSTVNLQRWIHMADRGWHSGDSHVHYARPDGEADRRLALWARAEDVEMTNVLRMGDARNTYFEQYGFGPAGRYLHSGGALVPGQEDPRTSVLGHTLHLDLQHAIRPAGSDYYDYRAVFREAGLHGYAHVNRSGGFAVERDMAINVPLGGPEFAEICEFGKVEVDLYYEFLNLGYQLTAMGGSDVPWGGTVGESRVYAFTGGKFDANAWFEAVRKGRTFVTSGPMLSFTVDGHYAGEVLTPKSGTSLHVHARRESAPQNGTQALEIVVNGDVVRTNQTGSLEFELRADASMWIAARTRGAHTTPIYISVEGGRHWNRSAAPALIRKRLETLEEIQKIIDGGGKYIGEGSPGTQESAEWFRQSSPGLRKNVERARAAYQNLANTVSRSKERLGFSIRASSPQGEQQEPNRQSKEQPTAPSAR